MKKAPRTRISVCSSIIDQPLIPLSSQIQKLYLVCYFPLSNESSIIRSGIELYFSSYFLDEKDIQVD